MGIKQLGDGNDRVAPIEDNRNAIGILMADNYHQIQRKLT
jgi:hypothetical protein